MSDTFGHSLPLPSMRFDLVSSCWRTCEATSLWELEMSSPTFTDWGLTRGGVLFELPTPERPTVAPESSSLPTPHAGLGERGRDGVYPNPRGQQDLQHAISHLLLPTPVADHSRGLAQPGTDFASLPNVAISLLPTPTVIDMGSNYTPDEWEAWKAKQKANHANGNGDGASLTQEALSLLPTPTVADTRDGKYLRQMTVDALKRAASKGLNLNHLVETLWEEMAHGSISENMDQQSEDGSECLDAQPQTRLSLE